jgi:DNA polymerase I-like protein with 3'-5' exonuclease and polymerase domains
MRPFPPLPDWVSLEHQVQQILTQQELHGWRFDESSAWKLASALRKELEETHQLLRNRHPFVFKSEFTPKRNNSTTGYVEGATFTRIVELNPSSRDHIAWILKEKYKWEPTELTPTGKPIIDEDVLNKIGSETATQFLKCLTVTKMLGMISEGTNAWLKLVTNNRIHHHCSVATNTHRCAHRNPNLGQVPSNNDFRKLFVASPGKVLVGADLSGIELRMLANVLAKYDAGRYAEILLTGDIHQVNADRIGISRRAVKTVTYAFLYGAGDAKIGYSFDPTLNDRKAKSKGKEIREAFVSAIDGLAELLAAIKKASAKGFIKSIDGRKILVDSPHKALNYCLQSGAGVVAKRWMVINDKTIKQKELQCNQLAFIHDELQFECHPQHAEYLSTSLVQSARQAGEYYNLRIPIAAEASVGNNWAETH